MLTALTIHLFEKGNPGDSLAYLVVLAVQKLDLVAQAAQVAAD